MSDRKTRWEQAATVPRGVMEDMTAVVQDAARQNDAAPSSSGEPSPSEPKTVKAQSYQRKFTIVKPFVRVGMPRMRIPNHLIRFEPELLPAGATEFQLALRDYNFVGANYSGTIRLSPAAAAPGAKPEEPITVTVGL
jgi:hypothetical protein